MELDRQIAEAPRVLFEAEEEVYRDYNQTPVEPERLQMARKYGAALIAEIAGKIPAESDEEYARRSLGIRVSETVIKGREHEIYMVAYAAHNPDTLEADLWPMAGIEFFMRAEDPKLLASPSLMLLETESREQIKVLSLDLVLLPDFSQERLDELQNVDLLAWWDVVSDTNRLLLSYLADSPSGEEILANVARRFPGLTPDLSA